MRWLLACLAWITPALADDVVLVQSTTSTQNSGLYEHLIPLAEAALGLDIRVVAVGTGQALRNAQSCDGDLVIVHARAAEEAFVAAGFGAERRDLMVNEFVLIGPEADPADIQGSDDITEAFSAIAEAQAIFVSRGDDSGTHQRELTLWPEVLDLEAASGLWYRETGSGMGATLNIAVAMGGYTLSDRATWARFANPGNHTILVEGDPRLENQYGIIPVAEAHCPNINAEAALALTDWLTSAPGQAAIAAFQPDGEMLFRPNAQ